MTNGLQLQCSELADTSDVLAQSWTIWKTIGDSLTTREWTRTTRLPGWTVKDLFAHVARGVVVLDDLLRAGGTGTEDLIDAAQYFRNVGAIPGGPKMVHDSAKDFADRHSAPELVRYFDVGVHEVLAGARQRSQDPVDTIGGWMAVEQYLVTRIVEAAVHLLDARASLNDVVEPSESSLRVTAGMLVELAGAIPFIELATGRRRRQLFPVLS